MEEGSGNGASLSKASLKGEPGGSTALNFLCQMLKYAVQQAISKGTLTKSRPI